jgi:putative tricarboxylic transport membrane protein
MSASLERSVVGARKASVRLMSTAALMLAAAATLSHAQQTAWRPERPVEVVIPSAAGSSLDAAARLIQRILTENRLVEGTVVVVNKPGGGGNLASNYMDQHAGDPHHMLLSAMSLMNNHILGRSPQNYDTYTPIAMLYSEHMTMVVKPDSALKTGRDIMEKLKGDPQALSIAIGFARGGTGHLNTALLAKAMGVDARRLKTVQFQGNSEALAAVMGGHVDLSSMSFAQAWMQSQAGRLRIIGVAAEKRGDGPLADIPTWKEQGFDVEFHNTRFMLGTKGMNDAQTEFWDNALRQVMQSERWKAMAEKTHYIPYYVGRKETPKRLGALYKQLKEALTDVGMAK